MGPSRTKPIKTLTCKPYPTGPARGPWFPRGLVLCALLTHCSPLQLTLATWSGLNRNGDLKGGPAGCYADLDLGNGRWAWSQYKKLKTNCPNSYNLCVFPLWGCIWVFVHIAVACGEFHREDGDRCVSVESEMCFHMSVSERLCDDWWSH